MAKTTVAKITAEQQQELDAWIVEREELIDCRIYATPAENRAYVEGYNAGIAGAAETIRQGNLTWKDYEKQTRNTTKGSG